MNSKENQEFNLLLIEYIFSKRSTKPEACNFPEKETLAQVFSCEFCEISKNTFFAEHLWTTASAGQKIKAPFSQKARKYHKERHIIPRKYVDIYQIQYLILPSCLEFALQIINQNTSISHARRHTFNRAPNFVNVPRLCTIQNDSNSHAKIHLRTPF